MDLGGVWFGEYTYGTDYGPGAETSVPFRLDLTEAGLWRWLGLARVTGTVQDDAARGGFPQPGTLDGRRFGRWVRFRKTMPECYLFDANGRRREIRDWLRGELGTDAFEVSPLRIAYEGAIHRDATRMEGRWRILPTKVLIQSQPWTLPGLGTGTWTASRR
jgi:hypothetical protein